MATQDLIMGQSYLPENNLIGPGPANAPKGPPQGFKPLTNVNPGINEVAKKLLGNAFGTLTPFTLNGVKYMARVEPHYHPPGYKSGPNGWHKGITVYQSNDSSTESKSQLTPNKIDREKLFQQIDKFLEDFGEI